MSNICFNQYLFLRTPALSYEDYDVEILKEILKSPFFQAAIFFASESLYAELGRFNFNYSLLDDKVKLSLQKYFNRMCYRPTPFGMFSAFSSITWNVFNNSQPFVLEEEKKVYVSPDFQFSVDLGKRMEKSGTFGNIKYYSNGSIYTMKGEKRYLTNRIDDDTKKTDFLIISYQTDRLLNKLISFSKNGKTKAEMVSWLESLTGETEEVKNYIDDTIEAGLLIPETYPNMTGEKYFNRLLKIASETNNTDEFTTDILRYGDLINSINKEGYINIKELTGSALYSFSKQKLKSLFYVAYEKVSRSMLDKKYQEYLKDGLECLDKFALDGSPRSLSTFKTKFLERFEGQEIPILQALDRETGIGYEGLESSLATSELLDGIQLDLQSSSLSFNWTPLHEFFLLKLSEIKNDECILISEKDLKKLQVQSVLKTPPSFSVIFRVFDDKVWIEQAGGCTATALLGRFTSFSEKVLEETRYIASVEEKLNDEVVFAEISCFTDEHAANINSGAGVRLYEIPIGIHSTLNQNNIISLADILISVVDNVIILRSKKLNKIIIPRLSSAYNYSRSELSIFRFLCDLQYQGLKSNYNFDLKSLLPGLNFYPRVEYKNCILFPSTWVLNSEEIMELSGGGEAIATFKKNCQKLKLKKQFALTEGDNQLLFDQDDAESVNMFIKTIKNKKSVILQEVFIEQSPVVKNCSGQAFVGQLIASVFSEEVVYSQKMLIPPSLKKNKVKRIYLPGDEWIYLKLYCHPAISNGILIKNIKGIIARFKKQNILKGWYFIRYADPDQHLRIRIQVNQSDAAQVVKYFEKRIRNHVENGSINKFLLDTYKREIERYGADTIEYVEKIFQVSSELIINYLVNITKEPKNYSELHLAIISVNAMLGVFFIRNTDKLALVRSMHENMKREFEDSKQVKIQLDNKYREYSWFINHLEHNQEAVIDIAGKKEFNSYLKGLTSLKLNAKDLLPGSMVKLVADLIHMHLNRLFNEKQRKHEFIIYYLLYKYYSSLEARKEKARLTIPAASESFTVNHINEVLFK